MRRIRLLGLGLFAAALGALGTLAACSAAGDAESIGFGGDAAAGDAGPARDTDASIGAAPITVDALVLVHAARFPPFRICFENAPGERPWPDTDVMPSSNVVGIDQGAAVRLRAPARPTELGRAFVFPEASIRILYPAFGGTQEGPTCGQLLASSSPHVADAVEVGTVDTYVGQGVHALVLEGCRPAAQDLGASTARCGASWAPGSGNLALRVVPLVAYDRPAGPGSFPLQLLQLSPSVTAASAGHVLGLTFGPLDAGDDALPEPLVEGQVPYASPVPDPPAVVKYDPDDLAGYATKGLFVTVGAPYDDAGVPVDAGPDAARRVIASESLEAIQRASSAQSLPTEWFAAASSYVLVSVGELDPRLDDGGATDAGARALHLLAIPLAAPDAGADAAP
ncbi:MAG: hypothetical protein JWP97_2026 [Labilithrix sp.]|nr:hypothetical protein [Labilithrix sp.]